MNLLGFDIDPLAFFSPSKTVSEIFRFKRERDDGDRDQASLAADLAAVQAIHQVAVAAVMSDPKAPAVAQAAQQAVDAANRAGEGVPKERRLTSVKEILTRAQAEQRAATDPSIAQLRGFRVRAAEVVAQAIEGGQPIPSPALPAATPDPKTPAAPAADYVTLLRQRSAAAKAKADRLKATRVQGDTMSGYHALAHHRTLLGEEGGGFDFASLFAAAGQGVQSVVNAKAKSDAQVKSAKDSEAALQASVLADQRAKDALARSLVSADLKSPSADADRVASSLADQAADAAAAGLSPENQRKRADAARAALERATREWQEATSAKKDAGTVKAKELWARAAGQVYARTQNALLVQAAQLPGGLAQQQALMQQTQATQSSWLTRRVMGPVPGWGVLTGGAAILGTVAAVLLKKKSS